MTIILIMSLVCYSCNNDRFNKKNKISYKEIPCDELVENYGNLDLYISGMSGCLSVYYAVLQDTTTRMIISKYNECDLINNFRRRSIDDLKANQLIWYFVVFSKVKEKRIQNEIIEYLSSNKNTTMEESSDIRCPYFYAKKAYFEINDIKDYKEIDCTNNGVWHGLPVPGR